MSRRRERTITNRRTRYYMKITLHIPTESFGFIEIEPDSVSPEAVSEIYAEYSKAFKPQEGLSDKDFNAFLDKYLNENTGNLETYNAMSDQQKSIIQAIKRSVKRIEARMEKKAFGEPHN